jgi:hypothetical protein
MTEVIFDNDDEFQIPVKEVEPKPEEIEPVASWLVKKGAAKSIKGANVVLVIVAIIFFALSIFFFALGGDIRSLFETSVGDAAEENLPLE